MTIAKCRRGATRGARRSRAEEHVHDPTGRLFCIDRNPMIALCSPFPDAVAIQVPKTTKLEHGPTFESALAELENIVTRMEGGQLSLENSLNAYKRGAELLKYCQAQLADAQQQVKVLEAGALQNVAGHDDNQDHG